MFSVPNDIKRPIRCNKLNLSSFHDSVNVMLYTWDEGWQQTEQIRWGRDCVFSCRLRLWQYAKNFKSTLETEGTRMSLTSFVRLLYISITPLSLNFYPISVTTSSEEGGRKKKEERCKNKLCVYKNLQSDESGEETRAPTRARLCAACWHCVTLALMVFHVEGCNAALSSWGDKAPAVTHHQQRNKIAKRWTQKEQGKNGVWGGEEQLVHGSLMNILIDSVICVMIIKCGPPGSTPG